MCTSSGMQGHWKATLAREFLKRKEHGMYSIDPIPSSMTTVYFTSSERLDCDMAILVVCI